MAQLFMLFTPIVLIEELCIAAMLARDEFSRFNTIRIVRPSATLALLVALVLFGALTPSLAVFAYIAPTLPITFYLSRLLWRSYQPRWFAGVRQLRRSLVMLFSYGLRSYGNELMTTLSENLGRALVVGAAHARQHGALRGVLELSADAQRLSVRGGYGFIP